MNEEVSKRRLLVVIAVLSVAILVVLVFLFLGNGSPQGDGKQEADTTTTTAAYGALTTTATITTSPSGAIVDQTTLAGGTRTTSREDRYDYPTVTTVDTPITNFVRIQNEFDGWTIYIDNCVYDKSGRALTFTMNLINTRKYAQPVYYEIFEDWDYPREYTEVELKPDVPLIYTTMDHLRARKVQVTVPNIDEDFTFIKIALETLSVPDDAGANPVGVIVTDYIGIRFCDVDRV